MTATPARDDTLRIAWVLGDTVLDEVSLPRGGPPATLGESPDATFVVALPITSDPSGKTVFAQDTTLRLLPDLEGVLHLASGDRSLDDLAAAGVDRIALEPEDWGLLALRTRPDVRFLVRLVPTEPVPWLPRGEPEPVLWAAAAANLLALVGFLGFVWFVHEPKPASVDKAEVSERMARIFAPIPEEEVPPPEPEPNEGARGRAASAPAKARGAMGSPRLVDRSQGAHVGHATDVGLVRELRRLQDTPALTDLLGVQGQLHAAAAGQDLGPPTPGLGSLGASTRGLGGGGGGLGGEGQVVGTGALNVGRGGGGTKRRSGGGLPPPTERKVAIEAGTSKVTGQLSKELIDRVVRQHRAQLGFCYNKELVRFPDLSGKVVLRFVIGIHGSVRTAKIASSSLGSAQAESCMLRALESWTFPKPEGGVVEVDYPFFFGTK